jgi:hypothetical protein
VVDVEELAGAQSKGHAFVVLAEMVVDLGHDQSSEFSLGKGFIFAKCFSARVWSQI